MQSSDSRAARSGNSPGSGIRWRVGLVALLAGAGLTSGGAGADSSGEAAEAELSGHDIYARVLENRFDTYVPLRGLDPSGP